jgi:hypothetical protein
LRVAGVHAARGGRGSVEASCEKAWLEQGRLMSDSAVHFPDIQSWSFEQLAQTSTTLFQEGRNMDLFRFYKGGLTPAESAKVERIRQQYAECQAEYSRRTE